MKLKKHRAFLLNFVIAFDNGDMSRREFGMDYSGYVIAHFPAFEQEHPRLSRKLVNTIDAVYEGCSWMDDERFREAMRDAVDEFLGTASKTDIC